MSPTQSSAMDCNNILNAEGATVSSADTAHSGSKIADEAPPGTRFLDTPASRPTLPDNGTCAERIEMTEAEHPLLGLPAIPIVVGHVTAKCPDCPRCGRRLQRSPRSLSLSVLPEEAPLRSDSDDSIPDDVFDAPDTPPNSPEQATGSGSLSLPCRCGKRRVSVSKSSLAGFETYNNQIVFCDL